MNIINTRGDRENTKNLKILIEREFLEKKTSVYLINGIKITGLMIAFELKNYIILKSNNLEMATGQMIFWSAIATITQNHSTYSILDYGNNKEEKSFLDDLLNKNIKVFLCNGIKLNGNLEDYRFKEYMIIEKDKIRQLILWNAVATVSLCDNHPINLKFIDKEKQNILEKNKNDLLTSLLDKDIVIFLKNGIKLKGQLTSFFYEEDFLTHIIIDENQLILIQHVSTITQA